MARVCSQVLVLLLIVLTLCGCFPAVSVQPAVIYGLVIDAQGRRVSAATVTVKNEATDIILAATQTSADGSFRTPASKGGWFIYLVPQDNPPPAKYIIEA
jgi:hypothetical protein